jgi:hypothetical protein
MENYNVACSSLWVRTLVSGREKHRLRVRSCPHEDSWYSFLLEAESTPGPSAAGRIR